MTQKVRNHDQFKNVQIEVDPSGELILTGIVKSAEERKLAEAYLRLEPGVTNIVNSIVVEQ
jgi:osmotically-inducible protein OsmY